MQNIYDLFTLSYLTKHLQIQLRLYIYEKVFTLSIEYPVLNAIFPNLIIKYFIIKHLINCILPKQNDLNFHSAFLALDFR